MKEITFKDGLIIDVELERGQKIFDLWMSGKPGLKFELDGEGYLVSDIRRIKDVHRPVIKPIEDSSRLLEASRCRGRRSIQREITKLIVRKYPNNWKTYIGDAELRNRIREYLRKKSTFWCDGNSCVCGQDYTPDPSAYSDFLAIFPNSSLVEIPQETRKDLV